MCLDQDHGFAMAMPSLAGHQESMDLISLRVTPHLHVAER